MLWGLFHPQMNKFNDPLDVTPDDAANDAANDLKPPATGMN
jgi:hypothetical protein